GGAVPQDAVNLVRLIADVTSNPERIESDATAAEGAPTLAGPIVAESTTSGPSLGAPTTAGPSFPAVPSDSVPTRSVLEAPPVSLAGPPTGAIDREVVADKEALRDALSR